MTDDHQIPAKASRPCAPSPCRPTPIRPATFSAAGSCRRWTWPAASSPIAAPEGRCATVAVTGMTFHLPVFIGDEVSCYAEIVKIGRTSITVKVETWVRRNLEGERIKVTEGIFTYVAIGPDRKPRPFRQLLGRPRPKLRSQSFESAPALSRHSCWSYMRGGCHGPKDHRAL